MVVTRAVRPGLQLGLEHYASGPQNVGGRPTDGVNLGATAHLHGQLSLLGSLGHALDRKQTIFYSSLKLDF